jgi:hypothetical protein
VEIGSTRFRRIAWLVFALEVGGVLVWAIRVRASAHVEHVDGRPAPDGTRFGIPEARRRAIFQDLVRGEPADRRAVEGRREDEIWDRNRDSFFHELEWRRVAAVAASHRLPLWKAYAILDEGIRQKWPPPPGVELRADDAPLARRTRPLEERPILTPAPPTTPPTTTAMPPP